MIIYCLPFSQEVYDRKWAGFHFTVSFEILVLVNLHLFSFSMKVIFGVSAFYLHWASDNQQTVCYAVAFMSQTVCNELWRKVQMFLREAPLMQQNPRLK